jgi:hypothetical protein
MMVSKANDPQITAGMFFNFQGLKIRDKKPEDDNPQHATRCRVPQQFLPAMDVP